MRGIRAKMLRKVAAGMGTALTTYKDISHYISVPTGETKMNGLPELRVEERKQCRLTKGCVRQIYQQMKREG